MKKILLILPILILAGCSMFVGQPIAPGADPFVVQVERFQTEAKADFDAILALDHSNRAWWKENAPGMHSFCEWLRQPQLVTNAPGGPINLPRDRAMLFSLNQIKVDYKLARATSNDVFKYFMTVKSAVNQSAAWMIVATNQPPVVK